MSITAGIHGNPVYWDRKEGIWRYKDINSKVDYENLRRCTHCNLLPTPEGHDGCLGTLDAVKFACCGHGEKDMKKTHAYIYFKDETVIRGEKALVEFKKRGVGPDAKPRLWIKLATQFLKRRFS